MARIRSTYGNYGRYKQFARKYNQIITEVAREMPLPGILDLYDLDKIPGGGKTLPYQHKEIFEGVHANLSLLKSILENRLGVIEDETVALRDFFQARLRSAVWQIRDSEPEVQDTVEQLLIGRGLQKGQDYDREVGRVKVSAKESVPDFTVPRLSLALELKLIESTARVREVVDEIGC